MCCKVRTVSVTTMCERDDCAFMSCEPTARLRLPTSKSACTSAIVMPFFSWYALICIVAL